MLQTGWGSIINMAPVLGAAGFANSAACTAKLVAWPVDS